jgi:hypothetical protein
LGAPVNFLDVFNAAVDTVQAKTHECDRFFEP